MKIISKCDIMGSRQRINIRGKYYEVTRDNQGKITSMEPWSSGGGRSSDCFIVTACYGTSDTLLFYREYRDRILLTSNIGIFSYGIYYQIGPIFARAIKNSNILKSIVKIILKQFKKYLGRKYVIR